MTVSLIGYLIAAVLLVGGIVGVSRLSGGRRAAVLAAAVLLAVVVGWFALLLSTAA